MHERRSIAWPACSPHLPFTENCWWFNRVHPELLITWNPRMWPQRIWNPLRSLQVTPSWALLVDARSYSSNVWLCLSDGPCQTHAVKCAIKTPYTTSGSVPTESLEHKWNVDTSSTTSSKKDGLWTLNLHGIRLHGWYQVIVWFGPETIIKGVSWRAWLLPHAYSKGLPRHYYISIAQWH